MDPADGDLLTTGQAATLLGCSRQHVVDLCDAGTLACRTVGRHRRVRRAEVEALGQRKAGPGSWTRDQVRSLWLHRAVAGKVALDAERVLALADSNSERMLHAAVPLGTRRNLIAWRRIIRQGPEEVMRTLEGRTPEARELRQGSPFTRVLSEAERHAVIRSFAQWWRTTHARDAGGPG